MSWLKTYSGTGIFAHYLWAFQHCALSHCYLTTRRRAKLVRRYPRCFTHIISVLKTSPCTSQEAGNLKVKQSTSFDLSVLGQIWQQDGITSCVLKGTCQQVQVPRVTTQVIELRFNSDYSGGHVLNHHPHGPNSLSTPSTLFLSLIQQVASRAWSV